MSDDYSFGVLQSDVHWRWFVARCSTLKGDFRYTSNTVFDTFPWPQSPRLSQLKDVAAAAVSLRELRRRVLQENNWNHRELYRTLEVPGRNPLKDAHAALDDAVRVSYGIPRRTNTLEFLLDLNNQLSDREAAGDTILGPGLPAIARDHAPFITSDCVRIP